jgi:NitT/TauT family transport system ATP-binding protein
MTIAFQRVTKKYGDITVFEDWSDTFEEGKTWVITGASGKGKTTFLRLLMGLEQPDAGVITGVRDKRFSCVFQEDRLLENRTVFHNIRLPQIEQKAEAEEIRKIAEDLASIGLEGCGDRKVKDLSGGMKRRTAILRALRAPADILVFDEASRGLDEENRKKTMARIREGIHGRTVFWVTHDERDLQDLEDPHIIDLDQNHV